MAKDVVGSYLSQYASPEARLPEWDAVKGLWDHFLVAPLCRERATIESLCASLEGVGSSRTILTVFLVNARKDAPQDLLFDNAATLAFLKEHFDATPLEGSQTCLKGQRGSITALILDRSSDAARRFEEREGIGLARKILSDLAVRFQVDGKLRYPWVHHTDGDARLSPDHFDVLDTLTSKNVAAFSHGFVHVVNPAHPETFSALAAYEIWLRHYALGLSWAGSPYGFPTIGSLISCRLEAYAQVRGFPQRMAGEDFYLLNKLAKVGTVRTLERPIVTLLDRRSDRVPFGTGAGVAKLLEKAARGERPTLYDPRVFEALKDFFESLAATFDCFSAEGWEKEWQGLPPCTPEELENAVRGAWQRGRTFSRAWREFHHWFDGFRTLKYVHALRDHLFPNMPLEAALNASPFIEQKGAATLEERLAALRTHPLSLDNWEEPQFLKLARGG